MILQIADGMNIQKERFEDLKTKHKLRQKDILRMVQQGALGNYTMKLGDKMEVPEYEP